MNFYWIDLFFILWVLVIVLFVNVYFYCILFIVIPIVFAVFYAKGLYSGFCLSVFMNKSKKLIEFEQLWAKIEKLRKDPKMMKALDRLIKITTS